MPSVKLRASVILGAFEEAQSELVGKAVVLTDGKAGTVENVWLDEFSFEPGKETSTRPRWPCLRPCRGPPIVGWSDLKFRRHVR